MHIKKGDNVVVVTGSHKGQKGTIAKVLGDRVIIEGVAKGKTHEKPKNRNEKGRIVERERSIHHSNVKKA